MPVALRDLTPMADDALVLATRVMRALKQKNEQKKTEKKMKTKTAEELNLLGAIEFGRSLAERDLEPFKLAYLKGLTIKTAAAAKEWLAEVEKLADAADVAREHPYLSTVLGPNVVGMLGAAAVPGGGVVALPAEIAATHYLSKGLKREREQAGHKGKPESFALRHPYLTGMGSRMAGGIGGAAAGGAAGYGIGQVIPGGQVEIPGVGHVSSDVASALLGAALGGAAGDITGRSLGTRAIMKGQERALGHKKHAELGSAYTKFAETLPEDQRESFFKIAEKVSAETVEAAKRVLEKQALSLGGIGKALGGADDAMRAAGGVGKAMEGVEGAARSVGRGASSSGQAAPGLSSALIPSGTMADAVARDRYFSALSGKKLQDLIDYDYGSWGPR